jgi:hypothetical protein
VDFDGLRQKMEMGIVAHSPRGQAKLPPADLPMSDVGIPVFRSVMVAEGEFFYSHDPGARGGKVVFVGPLTYWRLQHPGVEPMLSRHCRGIQELARDRRRYPRPVQPA